jgi:hypothetical protein
MCKAAGKWLMVLSLCTAIGLHWAALQSIAWVGMLCSYARAGSITSAVEKTFDGKHPCPLCNAIAKAQQGGKKPEMQLGSKIDMDHARQAELLIPPVFDFSWPVLRANGTAFAPEPSVPPPRAA